MDFTKIIVLATTLIKHLGHVNFTHIIRNDCIKTKQFTSNSIGKIRSEDLQLPKKRQ